MTGVYAVLAETGNNLYGLTLAKGELQLPRFIPGQPQAAAEGRTAHETHSLDAEPQRQRRMAGRP
jgi:hypothetical protein